MVRVINTRFVGYTDGGESIQYIEGFCNSDDNKPTSGIATGSMLCEANTGDVYMYDEETESWVKRTTL